MGQGRLYTVVAALHSDHHPQVQCTYFSEVEEAHSNVADVMDESWAYMLIAESMTTIIDLRTLKPSRPSSTVFKINSPLRSQCTVCLSFIQVTLWLFCVLALTHVVLYDYSCFCHLAYTSAKPAPPPGGRGWPQRLSAQHKRLPRSGHHDFCFMKLKCHFSWGCPPLWYQLSFYLIILTFSSDRDTPGRCHAPWHWLVWGLCN